MQLFLCHIENNKGLLTPEESHHACKVLRKQPGDQIQVTNGEGKYGPAEIVSAHAKECIVNILSLTEVPSPTPIHLGIALPKSRDRVEWLVEKAVEMGCTHIHPLICANSERAKLNLGRLEKIALSAMKQSAQFHLPQIFEAEKFSSWIKKTKPTAQAWIAYCPTDRQNLLIAQAIKKQQQYILIGPEGDFSQEEVDLAQEFGYQSISLGNNRLRTETAALAACNIISQKLTSDEEIHGAPHFTQA